jgi:hypothetical protein
LYQVATAALSPADIAEPIRVVLRHQQNATVLLDEVIGIAARQVKTCFGAAQSYDSGSGRGGEKVDKSWPPAASSHGSARPGSFRMRVRSMPRNR